MGTVRESGEKARRAGVVYTRPSPNPPGVRRRIVVLLGLLLLSVPAAVATEDPAPRTPPPAQATEEDQPSPETSPDDPEVTAAPILPDYLYPDLGANALVYDGKHAWIKPLFAFLLDYTWFQQDAASLAQVGQQADTGELRAGRVGVTLRAKGKLKWEFYTTVDFQERRTRETNVFQLYDLRFGIPLGPVKFQIGKMKEPISYELTGLSVLLPQQERILNPFYPSRSYGVSFSGRLAGDRMTWAAGVFNDWLDSGLSRDENGTDYVGRLTALAWESPRKSDYLHLGLGYRRVGSDDGIIRFDGRPESNVADKYIDTGLFPADHADEMSYELLVAHGPYSLLAERFDAAVDSSEGGDPHFSGYYAAASWMVTGEIRPYVHTGAFAGGIVPKSRFGALELVLRFSRLDLTDGLIAGGELDKWHIGVNWWASTQWKVGLSWGDADLDRGGYLGNTKMVLARLQWLWG